MINILTKEQENKIPEYFKKWYDISHTYKDINMEKIRPLLNDYLSIINIKPKFILKFSSPFMCQLAINVLKNIKVLYSQLDSQLRSQLNSQLRSQLNSQLRSQLDSQLRSQLYSQLNSQLYLQFDSQLRSQLYLQFDSQLYSQLYLQFDSQLNSQLRLQLHSQLDSQLDSQLYSQLRSQLDSQLDSQLYSQLDSQLDSQFDSQFKKIKLEYFGNYFYECGNIISGYCAFYDFLISEVKQLDEKTMNIWNSFKNICENLHYIYIFKDFVFVSEFPTKLYFKNNQLHNENVPSVLYKDGYSLYALNGVSVSKEIVEIPWNKLDSKLILKEKNAEVRREIVRKIGIEKICNDLNAKCIDKKDNYELLMLDLQDNRIRPYLKMKNPSIGVYHIEGVHPGCKTVEDALNFRNRTKETPIILT